VSLNCAEVVPPRRDPVCVDTFVVQKFRTPPFPVYDPADRAREDRLKRALMGFPSSPVTRRENYVSALFMVERRCHVDVGVVPPSNAPRTRI